MKSFESTIGATAPPTRDGQASRTTDDDRRMIQKGSIPADPIAPPEHIGTASGIGNPPSPGQQGISNTIKADS